MTQLVNEDQPAYKAMEFGFGNLSTTELLCLLIQQGSKAEHLETTRQLMYKVNNNITELGKLSVSDLTMFRGIGKTKALAIGAAYEFARRKLLTGALQKTVVRSSRDIAEYLQAKIGNEQVENFAVVLLNRANKINHVEIISKGGITGTVADPRVIIKLALENNATSIVLCHNHPSGNLRPSRADEDLTKKIKSAAAYFDINVMDHIIVSEDGFYSFADEGIL